jgi:hypothetical protein
LAGFALIIDNQGLSPSPVWQEFLRSTAAYKALDVPADWAQGLGCTVAKLDAPPSLHRGITRDESTSSWLLAVGTVIDTAKTASCGNLDALLQDYLALGEGVFSRLDGQFSLVLYDARAETTLVVSDPFGMIPIFYAGNTGQTFISTSGLAVARAVGSPPSEFGTRAFILYADTFGDTLWRDVHILPPATVLKIDREGMRQSAYWSFQVDETIAGLSEKQAVDCMIEGFDRSMRRALEGEGEVWVSLTGGLDSRTLAALAQHSQIPFKTYCHGPRDSRDVRIAEQISRKMGWEYEYFGLPQDWGTQRATWFGPVLGQTDGLLDIIKMSRTIREQTIKAQQMAVSLWGYGGELHRGVYWKHEFGRAGKTTRVDYERLMDFRVIPAGSFLLRDVDHWIPLMRAEIISRLQQVGEAQPDRLNTVKLDMIGTVLERHACGVTVAAVLGQQRVILPFDFKDNITRIFSVNYRWRAHARMLRAILERINPALAEIETADGGPALPMRLSNSYRFIPYWLDSGEKLIWLLGNKITGKSLWQRRNAGPKGQAYPNGRWLLETVSLLEEAGVLELEKMCSAEMYQAKHLRSLLDFTQPYSKTRDAPVSRVIAVEMALRLANTGCQVPNEVEIDRL